MAPFARAQLGDAPILERGHPCASQTRPTCSMNTPGTYGRGLQVRNGPTRLIRYALNRRPRLSGERTRHGPNSDGIVTNLLRRASSLANVGETPLDPISRCALPKGGGPEHRLLITA